DSHLLEVLRYIHRNPLRAGIVSKLNDFVWSSHHGYVSKKKQWGWLHKDFLLSMLSDKKSSRMPAYIDFVAQSETEEIGRFYSLKNLASVLGSAPFKDWLKDKFDHLRFHTEIPESRKFAPSPERIIGIVCEHFKVKKEQIAVSKRGTENFPRDVAIYLVRRHSRVTLAAVGKHFQISNYSTVSSAVERIKARKEIDRALQKHLEKIEIILTKSQQQT
ncbi:MAG: transposase, partial [Proteobacteria bacterium]|nr:transposase [Pseudomonadota bacterium]